MVWNMPPKSNYSNQLVKTRLRCIPTLCTQNDRCVMQANIYTLSKTNIAHENWLLEETAPIMIFFSLSPQLIICFFGIRDFTTFQCFSSGQGAFHNIGREKFASLANTSNPIASKEGWKELETYTNCGSRRVGDGAYSLQKGVSCAQEPYHVAYIFHTFHFSGSFSTMSHQTLYVIPQPTLQTPCLIALWISSGIIQRIRKLVAIPASIGH